MGDPAGVGPEVVVKAFQDGALTQFCKPFVVGDAGVLQKNAALLGVDVSIHAIRQVTDARFQPGQIDVLDLANVPPNLPSGKATVEGGRACAEYIQRAVELARNREIDAIATAPINKEAMHLGGFPFPGHTEFLAHLTDTPDSVLLMVGKKLRVVLATTHLSLKDVPGKLTTEGLEKTLRIVHDWLERYVSENPKIAVCGLNPHCGDGGIFGDEETKIILPAVESMKRQGVDISGPFSADALFPRARSGEYDVVVAMYHDQGMIPVKMESMGHAVNVTLGLPIIRTSPDHGTAYDIAGKGLASAYSLAHAVEVAAGLCKTAVKTQ